MRIEATDTIAMYIGNRRGVLGIAVTLKRLDSLKTHLSRL